MKKGWRIILGIVLAAVLFGGLCCGVGILTGADSDRIILNLDERYHICDESVPEADPSVLTEI